MLTTVFILYPPFIIYNPLLRIPETNFYVFYGIYIILSFIIFIPDNNFLKQIYTVLFHAFCNDLMEIC